MQYFILCIQNKRSKNANAIMLTVLVLNGQ